MKKGFILVIFGLLSIQSVFAASTIAEKMTSGGFGGPAAPAHGVYIQDDGKVYYFSGFNEFKEKDAKWIATIQPEVLKAFQKKVSEIKSSQLELEDPTAPECADAPSTSFEIIQDSNKFPIATIENCRKSFLKYREGEFIINLLDGFEGLGRL
jgi:hypothetical protein